MPSNGSYVDLLASFSIERIGDGSGFAAGVLADVGNLPPIISENMDDLLLGKFGIISLGSLL